MLDFTILPLWLYRFDHITQQFYTHWKFLLPFCGPPAMLEGPLRFHLSHCLYGCIVQYVLYLYWCTDVGFSSTSKVNLRFSNENAMTDFRKTLYVVNGGTSTTPWSVTAEYAYLIPNLHICCDWLITKSQRSRVLYGLH